MRAMSRSVAILVAVMATVSAQAATVDPALKAFLAKFADMAARGAAGSMAEVTRFPLKNAVYQEPNAISRGGCQTVALRAENTVKHHVACHAQHFDQLAVIDFEQPHFAMPARRAASDGQKLPIGAVMNRVRPLADAGNAADELAVGRIPHRELVVTADE